MAHDPNSTPKFLVAETGHQKLVWKLRTPDTQETGTRNMASPFSLVHFDGQNVYANLGGQWQRCIWVTCIQVSGDE